MRHRLLCVQTFHAARRLGWSGQGGGAAAPVSVAEVIERDVRQWHEFSGRLVAVDQADIRPRVSGTVDSIHFKDGAMVKKGDTLFTIDPRPYQAAPMRSRQRPRVAFAEAEFRAREDIHGR